MFDPPISEGAQIFLWIVVTLISFAGAVSIGDVLKEKSKKTDVKRQEKLK